MLRVTVRLGSRVSRSWVARVRGGSDLQVFVVRPENARPVGNRLLAAGICASDHRKPGPGGSGLHRISPDFSRSHSSSGSPKITNVAHHEPPKSRTSGLPWIRRFSLTGLLELSFQVSLSLSASLSQQPPSLPISDSSSLSVSSRLCSPCSLPLTLCIVSGQEEERTEKKK